MKKISVLPKEEKILCSLKCCSHGNSLDGLVDTSVLASMIASATFFMPEIGVVPVVNDTYSIYTLKLTKDKLYLIDEQETFNLLSNKKNIHEYSFDEIENFIVHKKDNNENLDIYFKDNLLSLTHIYNNQMHLGKKIKEYITNHA